MSVNFKMQTQSLSFSLSLFISLSLSLSLSPSHSHSSLCIFVYRTILHPEPHILVGEKEIEQPSAFEAPPIAPKPVKTFSFQTDKTLDKTTKDPQHTKQQHSTSKNYSQRRQAAAPPSPAKETPGHPEDRPFPEVALEASHRNLGLRYKALGEFWTAGSCWLF